MRNLLIAITVAAASVIPARADVAESAPAPLAVIRHADSSISLTQGGSEALIFTASDFTRLEQEAKKEKEQAKKQHRLKLRKPWYRS